MEKLPQTLSSFRFGAFELDARTGELASNGDKIRLHEQPLQILLALLENPGELVSRETLVARLWPTGTYVDFDRSLNKAVNKLRDALDDSAEKPRFIETLPRRGYRFIETVTCNGNDWPITPQATSTYTPLVHRRWLFLAAAAVVILTLGSVVYFASRHRRDMEYAATSRVSLVVLPFDNLSGDAEQDYFSDGMTEEMITELGQFSPQHVAVIARATSMQYKGSRKTAEQIGRELHVDYLLEGSVRRSDSRVHITAELVRAKDQAHLWARSFDRDLRDILTLPTDVAAAIANQISIKLDSSQSRSLQGARQVNPTAYEDYMKGLHYLRLWDSDRENVVRSQPYFERAITVDPGYAQAYIRLAQGYFLGVFQGKRPLDVMPKVESLTRTALLLDPGLAEAHDVLANVALRYHYDFGAAEQEARLAIELNPNYPEAHDTYADYLMAVGREEEALSESRRASELDPLLEGVTFDVGFHLLLLKRYDEALAQFRKLLEPEVNAPAAHYWMGNVYAKRGMHKEAVTEWVASYTVGGDKKLAAAVQHAYEVSGYEGVMQVRVQNLTEEVEQLSRKGKWFVDPVDRAVLALQHGKREEAFKWLEEGYEERCPDIPMLMVPASEVLNLDQLRGDPRFLALVRRVGIPYHGTN